MLRIRRIEEEIERRYHQDQMKTPIHLVIGQEAHGGRLLRRAARRPISLYSSHRTHGAYLAKGGDLQAMLCEMHCRVNGCVGSRGGSMHLIDKRVGMAGTSAIVGGAVPIATGAALAAQMKRERRASSSCSSATRRRRKGVTSESLNFAALKQLPVMFFCENNFYSVQSPLCDAAAAARHPAVGRGLRDAGGARWTASTSWPCTMRSRDAVDASASRRRPDVHRGAGAIDSARTAAPATTAGPAIAPRPSATRGSRRSAPHVRRVPDAARRCSTTTHDRGEHGTEIAAEIAEAFEFALASPNPAEADLYRHVVRRMRSWLTPDP